MSRSVKALSFSLLLTSLLGLAAGCGDDDGGSGGGTGRQLERACGRMVQCLREQYEELGLDIKIDEDGVCEGFDAWRRVIGVSRACENAVGEYFECVADQSCADFAEGDVCEGAAARAESACED